MARLRPSAAALAAITLAWAIAGAPAAHAQARARDAAEEHFAKGRAAAKQGDYATACAELAESQRLEAAPGTLLNLADCEEHLGRRARAWQDFMAARDGFGPSDERAGIAAARAAALEREIARVTVRLAPAAPPGTRVEHAGADVAPGTVVALDPGTQTFEVVAPGRPARRLEITAAAGEMREVTLDAPEAPASAPAPSASASPRPDVARSADTRRTVGWVLGATGVASLAVGTVAGIVVANDASVYKQHCDATGCDGEGLDAASSGKTFQIVSPIALGVGAACLAAGIVLVFTGRGTTVTASASPTTTGGGLVRIGGTY